MDGVESGCLPSGVPRLKPEITHYVSHEELRNAYQKINQEAQGRVWRKYGIEDREDFKNISEEKHEQISKEYHLLAYELTKKFDAQVREQLGINDSN